MQLSEAESKLRPLLVTQRWVEEKDAALAGLSVPYCSLAGREGAFDAGLGLVCILDLGASCVPVTSKLLEEWGVPFAGALQRGVRCLEQVCGSALMPSGILKI
jgi:hypothetical protein